MRSVAICAGSLALSVLPGSAFGAVALVQLQSLPGNVAGQAGGLSSNGQYIAGQRSAGGVAVRWGPSGVTQIGHLGSPSVFVQSSASSASNNGEVVVGVSQVPNDQPAGYVPFYWTEAGGIVRVPQGVQPRYSTRVSGNGSMLVGAFQSYVVARYQIGAAAPQVLSGLVGRNGETTGVSLTGDTIAGFVSRTDVPSSKEAFVWNSDSGVTFLPHLSVADKNTLAEDVSSNGQVVVGYSTVLGSETRAFRWTASGGMQSLGTLPGDIYSFATAVSADGQVVVGGSRVPGDDKGFIWTPHWGMLSVKDYAAHFGLDLTGWTLFRVTDVSDDGLAFSMQGRTPQNQLVGVVLYVPTPPSLAIVLMGGALHVQRRRRS